MGHLEAVHLVHVYRLVVAPVEPHVRGVQDLQPSGRGRDGMGLKVCGGGGVSEVVNEGGKENAEGIGRKGEGTL